MQKPVLAIDFDGTICDHRFPECGPLKEGVVAAIQKISERFEIIIWSCRANGNLNTDDRYIKDMIEYLNRHNIPYDRIDMGNEGKVIADLYIDDKAIRFNDWATTLMALGVSQ